MSARGGGLTTGDDRGEGRGPDVARGQAARAGTPHGHGRAGAPAGARAPLPAGCAAAVRGDRGRGVRPAGAVPGAGVPRAGGEQPPGHVVDGVCDTFAAADLSDEAVLAADANPAEIVRRVTGAVRPPAGLGEAESRLYERLFVECVEYYVRIVQGLPVFEERGAERAAGAYDVPGARRSPGCWNGSRTAPCSPRRERTGTATSGAATWSWSATAWTRSSCSGVRPDRAGGAGTAVGGVRQPARHGRRRRPAPSGPLPRCCGRT